MPLTDREVRSIKPAEKRIRLSDGGGLYLEVNPNGAKRWRLAYRYAGKQRTLALGPYPEVKLSDAREARDKAKADLRVGVDPTEADAPVAARAARAAPEPSRSWRKVADEYLQVRVKGGIADATERRLRAQLSALDHEFGDDDISEVDAPRLLAFLRRWEDLGRYEAAARYRMTASRVFRYAIATGRVAMDPTYGLRGALAPHKVNHFPAKTEPREVGALLRAIRAYHGAPEARVGLLLSAHVFLRSAEMRGATWSEIDWDAAQWVVPADRMKMKRKHVVPLSRQAIELLREIQPVTGRRGFIFASPVKPGQPVSENTFNQALKKIGYGSGVHVHHGFRTTASTNLNEMGWNADWIEAQLAHVQGNSVRRAYNAAQYIEGRTEMMQAWSDWLDKVEGED